MRTKTLLCAAAVAACAISAMADNVYSLNVVGYVNVPLHANKLDFVSVPLAPSDGNFSINNTIKGLTDDAMFTSIYAWKDATWDTVLPTYYGVDTGWDPDYVISNGVAFFISSPVDATITFVGEVPQGAVNYAVPANLSTLANKVPETARFPGADVGNFFDNMYLWDSANNKWSDALWTQYGGGWDNGGFADNDIAGPTLAPGQGVFYVNSDTANGFGFTRNFTVAP